MTAPRSLFDGLADAVKPALGSLAATGAGVVALDVVLAWRGYLLAAGGVSAARGLLGLAATLAVCVPLGTALVTKRAVFAGLLGVLDKRRLGAAVLGRSFDLLLPAAATPGALTVLDRVPLAEAEDRLRRATASLTSAAPERGVLGWIGQRVEERVVAAVEAMTLARFRAEGENGVDLVRVRDELTGQVDGAIAAHLRAARRKLTLLVLAGSVGGSLLVAALVGLLPIP